MKQTPVHEHHNPDLLRLIAPTSTQIIEIGCGSGALAREFKRINPACHYLGIDIDEEYARLANRHCDQTTALNVDEVGADFFKQHQTRDCWIFGDTLEHLRSPWKVLRGIRDVIPVHGCVLACIPNAQP